MSRSPVALRYARALFELALEQGRLDAVQADFEAIAALRKDRATFERIINPYTLPQENRAAFWKELLGGHADALTLRFILFLISKGRGIILADIIRAFNELCYEARGIQPVEIVSARPLPAEQLEAITARFEARLKKKLHATPRVDPSLLGGFQVRVRDTIYDFSVNHQLNQLQRSMTTA